MSPRCPLLTHFIEYITILYPYDPRVHSSKEAVSPLNGGPDRVTVVQHPSQLEGREVGMDGETTLLLEGERESEGGGITSPVTL